MKIEFINDKATTSVVVYPVSVKHYLALNSLTLFFENDEVARTQEYGLKTLNAHTVHHQNSITILDAHDLSFEITRV